MHPKNLNLILQPLGIDQGIEKRYPDAHEAAVAVVALKRQIMEAGGVVISEIIRGDALVCTFDTPDGTNLALTQNVNTFGITIQ